MSPQEQPPAWAQDAIVYLVFPDRFARGDAERGLALEPWDAPPTQHGLKGGDLEGLRERLAHLEALSVNTLCLTPIFSSPSSHRYHTHDYHQVDPALGGGAAFARLLAACEARSMRVILDAVFNHSGRSFLPFADLLQNGPRSPYRDWFHVERYPLNAYGEGPPGFACWQGIPELPKLRTEHPAVRDYLYGVAERWAQEGVAGWRFDAPTQVQTAGFFEALRRRLRSSHPELLTVGEVWTDGHEHAGPGRAFDAVTHYWLGGAILVYASGGRFRFDLMEGREYPLFRERLDAGAFGDAVEHILSRYEPATARTNLTLFGSHDTPRARTLAGDADGLRLAFLLSFTLPGAPCVFYGDEIAMEGEHDPACRGGFPWDAPARWDHATLEAVRDLGAVRTALSPLRRGSFARVDVGGELFAFVREHEGARVLVATNAGDAPASAPCLERGALRYGAGELSAGRLAVPGRSGGVWALEP